MTYAGEWTAGDLWSVVLPGAYVGNEAGAILSRISTGLGPVTFVYTLTSAVDGSPIDDCWVGVYTEAAMTNLIASGRTNALGRITFYLDAGTYYLARSKSGWNLDNPDIEIVA